MSQNIKVAVRIRPFNERELRENSATVTEVSENGKMISLIPIPGSDSEVRNFSFDFVHNINSRQEDVFQDMAVQVVDQALEGYNGTIFAYGQTGSGKTFTMMGSPGNKGIIPRLSELVFDRINSQPVDSNCKFLLTVSFLEIYNEELHDLLNPKSDNNLQIREHPDLGIYVENLCELVVSNASEVLQLIEQGNAVRRVAATSMNEKSSRSHSCFTINLEKKSVIRVGDCERETSLTSKINLVDLAGSERAKKTGATGQTLKEGSNINKSLMTLGLVINALSEGKQCGHIPYRDSKLTRLLQQSLGGNSRTIMLAAISPAGFNYDETLSTLRYATRAKSIQNEVTKNEDVNEKIIRELKQEIDRLRNQSSGPAVGAGLSSGEVDELNNRLNEMRNIQMQTWQEKQSLTETLEKERQENVSRVISTMMDAMKNEKLEVMKNLKRYQNEKQTLIAKQKGLKEKCDEIKRDLELGLRNYQELSGKFDGANEKKEKDELNDELDSLLPSIERLKEDLVGRKKATVIVRERIGELDGLIDQCKAELISSSSVLHQHEKLVDAIRIEERAKFELEQKQLIEINQERQLLLNEQFTKHDEVVSELEECRHKIHHLSETNSALEEENANLKAELERLMSRIVDSELKLERAEERDSESSNDSEKEEEESKSIQLAVSETKASDDLTRVKRESQEMFRFLLQSFDTDSKAKDDKIGHLQSLLESACRDIMFLSSENKKLQNRYRL